MNGTNYLNPVRSQYSPHSCGSCWAHATTSALSDRIRIRRNNKFPHIILSPQVLLSCLQDEYPYLKFEKFFPIILFFIK